MTTFQVEQQFVKQQVVAHRWAITSLLSTGIGAAACAVLFTGDIPKSVKTAMLGYGAIACVTGGVLCQQAPKRERLLQAMQEADQDHLSSTLAHKAAQAQMGQDRISQGQILQQIVFQPNGAVNPIEIQEVWAKQYGVFELWHAFAKAQGWIAQPPVKQTQPQQAIATQPKQAIAPVQSTQVPASIEMPKPEELPVEDIARLIAERSLTPSTSSSVMACCPRGTGKSNFLRACIAEFNQVWQGNVDFYVFDGKGGETFCGLEKSPNDYRYWGDRDRVESEVSYYDRIVQERCKEFPGFPTVVVSDEHNNGRSAAQTFDSLEKTKVSRLLDAATNEMITKGRSKRCLGLLTSHSVFVKDMGINTQIRDSLERVILARGSYTQAVYKALYSTGTDKVVDNDEILEALKTQFQAYVGLPNSEKESKVLCLTNVGGSWRLVYLPRYPDQQPELDRGILNQSATDHYEQPTPQASTQGVFQRLKAQVDPTDTEAIAHAYHKITGATLTDEQAQYIVENWDSI